MERYIIARERAAITPPPPPAQTDIEAVDHYITARKINEDFLMMINKLAKDNDLD